MKLAIVGPGIMDIPPKSWGAVEILVHDYANAMGAIGWEVLVVNTPDRREIIRSVNNFAPDFVHIHYDEFAILAEQLECPNVAVTSHFGYLDQVWGHLAYRQNVHRVIVQTQKLRVFALSPSIAEVYVSDGKPPSLISVLPNGVQTSLFRQVESPSKGNRSICLGKIEPRKQQGLLQSLDSDIDFAGIVGDVSGRWPFDTTRPEFLGAWTKKQVYEQLGEYGNLVLLSDGEAHPLVVMEAMACGLGVVVSDAAAANLDRSLPFVEVIPQDRLTDRDYVRSAIARNRQTATSMRSAITRYAQSMDWSVAARRFDSVIRSIIAAPRSVDRAPSRSGRRKIALLTVATGQYFELFYRELRTSALKNFSPDDNLHIFCFTDRPVESNANETFCKVPELEWPFSTLLRFKLFAAIEESLRDFDIVVYLDSDMRVERPMESHIFDMDFFAVEHPSFRRATQRRFAPNPPPFESDSGSGAYVEAASRGRYVQGCFFGGKRMPFLYLTKKLAAATADDLRSGNVPAWHDESYLNLFFSKHSALILPPQYAYPEGWKIPGPAVITHRRKQHDAARSIACKQVNVEALVTSSAATNKELYRRLYLQAHEKGQRLEARLAQLEDPILALRWHVKTAGRRTRRSLGRWRRRLFAR